MALFGRYQQQGATPDVTQATPTMVEHGTGKGRPTPTREEALAARMAALHPKLSKSDLRKQEREADRKRQISALAEAESKPERVLLRNYIDSRWSLGEFFMPLVLLMLIGLFLTSRSPVLATFFTLFVYVFLFACIINIVIAWRGFRRELADRLPKAGTKGLAMMFATRMLSIRRFRTPGPAIPRHGKY